MTNLSKWNVSIDYGVTANDTHDIVVDAISADQARVKAREWANNNKISNPIIGEPYESTDEEWDTELDFVDTAGYELY